MYVNITAAGIHLAETDVFTAFEVRTPLSEGELTAALAADAAEVSSADTASGAGTGAGGWGYFADGHVWVSRERILAEVEPFHEHVTRWREQFDDMIAYAAKQGWLDETGRFVRAHVEYL